MRLTLIAAALVAVFAGPALAQQPTFRDSLLDHLAGRWVLQGTIAGSQTTHDVTAEWVLTHQYLRIHEVSREQNAKGQPAYEAIVFVGWDQPASEYVCVWLDDYGGIYTQSLGHAKGSGDDIPFVFAIRGGSTFHTTFAYDRSTDSWQWRMDAEQKGEVQPFARVKLVRKERSARR